MCRPLPIEEIQNERKESTLLMQQLDQLINEKDKTIEEGKQEQIKLQKLCEEERQERMKLQTLYEEEKQERMKLQRLCEEERQERMKLRKLCEEERQERMKLQRLCEEERQERMKLQRLCEEGNEQQMGLWMLVDTLQDDITNLKGKCVIHQQPPSSFSSSFNANVYKFTGLIAIVSIATIMITRK